MSFGYLPVNDWIFSRCSVVAHRDCGFGFDLWPLVCDRGKFPGCSGRAPSRVPGVAGTFGLVWAFVLGFTGLRGRLVPDDPEELGWLREKVPPPVDGIRRHQKGVT